MIGTKGRRLRAYTRYPHNDARCRRRFGALLIDIDKCLMEDGTDV
jgi:hypothetical protein